MLQLSSGKEASQGESAPQYARHCPERTLLYQLIDEYYPAFEAQWAFEGRVLPDYVRQAFDAYLKCGRLEHGFSGQYAVIRGRFRGGRDEKRGK